MKQTIWISVMALLVAGAARADFDQDGRADLLVVGPGLSVVLYRNQGNKFIDVTPPPAEVLKILTVPDSITYKPSHRSPSENINSPNLYSRGKA